MDILSRFVILLVSSAVIGCLVVPFLDRCSNFECFIIGIVTVAIDILVYEKLCDIIEGEV